MDRPAAWPVNHVAQNVRDTLVAHVTPCGFLLLPFEGAEPAETVARAAGYASRAEATSRTISLKRPNGERSSEERRDTIPARQR